MSRVRPMFLGTRTIATLAISLLAASCDARDAVIPASASSGAATSAVEADVKTFKAFDLTIYGYNYTDTALGSFEVNGRGGGNLEVSTLTAGGSKSTCCAAIFTPLPKDRPITIKWNRDGDTWCEQDVAFTGPVPSDAKYLEVHFYQDGHIEIAATAEASPPRLKLERESYSRRRADSLPSISNDTKHSRCKHGYF